MSLQILMVDDDSAARFGMKRALKKFDCDIEEAENGKIALQRFSENPPGLVFMDLNMPVMDGLECLQILTDTQKADCEIIVVTANDGLQSAVSCLQQGATDYITKPYEIEQLRAIVRRNVARVTMQQQLDELKHQLKSESACGSLVGVSPIMQKLYQLLRRAAKAPLDILIGGETGTGKELIAREIHRLSDRNQQPFVAVNTAAISESLAESQLFGHRKGAFTGADRAHQGVFEQANGGTLFLDEIGDMPLALQAKVLRSLQERQIQPLGCSESIAVDVRIISATHQDLNNAISEGEFRQDLYYRIKGIELNAPPLRKRKEDILLLARYFLNSLELNPVPHLSDEAATALLNYHWPGNVRELQQIILAAGTMAEHICINSEDLNLPEGSSPTTGLNFDSLQGLPLSEAKNQLVSWFEKQAIETALVQSQGNVSAAARQLGIHRQSLQQKMQQLGIQRPL